MTVSDDLLATISASHMTAWIGHADHRIVAHENFNSIKDSIDLKSNFKILDFGCGIGRTSVMLAEYLTKGELVGIDIIPDQIKFCREHFAKPYPQARFFCNIADSPHYRPMMDQSGKDCDTITDEQIVDQFSGHFDAVVAFSVFTHFDPALSTHYLKLLGKLIKPKGCLFLTWFVDHETNDPDTKVLDGVFLDRFPNSPLAWATHATPSIMSYADDAGLVLDHTVLGYWREDLSTRTSWDYPGRHYQDILIFRSKINS